MIFIYIFEWNIFLFELWFDIYDFIKFDYILTLIPSQWGLFIGTLIPSQWVLIIGTENEPIVFLEPANGRYTLARN